MASRRFEWDAQTRQYRDRDTGRFLSRSTIVDLAEQFIESRRALAADLARMLAERELSLPRWLDEMRELVRTNGTAEYLLGRGGRNALTPEDEQRLGNIIRDQWTYLQDFARDVQDGRLSPAQVRARAEMYTDAGINAHSMGAEASYGGLRLPVHPGDGGTPCLTRCRCSWSIAEEEDRWLATWRLGGSDPCAGCATRSHTYAPYEQVKFPEGVAA